MSRVSYRWLCIFFLRFPFVRRKRWNQEDTTVEPAVWRLAQERKAEPAAASCDSHTLQATPASGTRAGYDGAKRHRGSKGYRAVDTLGHLLALHVSAANEQDRSQVSPLAAQVQVETAPVAFDHVQPCGAKVTCTAIPVMRCCPLRGSRCVTPLGMSAFTFIPGTPCGTTTVPGKTPLTGTAGI